MARRPQHFKSVHFEQQFSPKNNDDSKVKEADKKIQPTDKNESGLESSLN